MRYFWAFLLTACCGCHLEVNTVDPQAGITMAFSQKHKFFIDSCQVIRGPFSGYVKEAWIENAWKNEIQNFKVTFKKLKGRQLVLSLDSSSFLTNRDYLLNWKMIDSLYGTFGSNNGVFVLDLPEDSIPNRFNVSIVELQPQQRVLCTLDLQRM